MKELHEKSLVVSGGCRMAGELVGAQWRDVDEAIRESAIPDQVSKTRCSKTRIVFKCKGMSLSYLYNAVLAQIVWHCRQGLESCRSSREHLVSSRCGLQKQGKRN